MNLLALLGFRYPIVSAGTASAARSELVAAVCNAGGFGFLGCGGLEPALMRERIAATRALTNRPFGVNLLLPKLRDGQVEVCAQERVKCVALFWGDPGPHVLRLHEAGVLVAVQIGSVAEAGSAVKAGTDIVIAQGHEAGGHVRGTVSTLALVPAVVDAVSPVPVIAAGGVADGRGLVAVLALGAQAAAMGTRFICSSEAACHPEYKNRIVDADETDTVYTKLFDRAWENAEHRVLRNRQVREWEAAGSPPPGQRPGEGEVIGHFTEDDGNAIAIPRYSSFLPRADFTGDLDLAALYAGQSCGLIHEIKPAAEIVAEIMAEARELAARLVPASLHP